MEREAVFQFRQFAAIEVIAADRAADMRQMHANLVGAPGLQPQADERAASGGLLDAVMRYGAPSGRTARFAPVPRRAIGASITPSRCAGTPSVTARYSRMKLSV